MATSKEIGLEIGKDAHVYIEGLKHVVLANIPVTNKADMSQPQNVLLRQRMKDMNGVLFTSYIVHYYNDPARCGDGATYQGGYYNTLYDAMIDVTERIQHASRYSNAIN
jgi:hypothetical protein